MPHSPFQSGLTSRDAISIAVSECRPGLGVPYEPMFDSKQTLTHRLADAADLLIDFATLGEYGLEPVGRTTQPCEAGHRPPASRQPRDRRCAPKAPGKSAPTTFSIVESDSPYFDILCGSRARLASAGHTSRGVVLSRPNGAAIRPPCVLPPLGPAPASRTRRS
jgi:hypothetical protein